jgi:peptide chain release factor 2
MNDLQKRLENLLAAVNELEPQLQLTQRQAHIASLAATMAAPGFWDNPQAAGQVSQEYSAESDFITFWQTLPGRITELQALLASNTDDSADTMAFLASQTETLERDFHDHRTEALLSGEHDSAGAIIALHAGAGGSDAQDWTEMLLRMYLRFIDRHHWTAEIIEQHKGSEAGIKSVTIEVKGHNAYGWLKNEAGVHRLVRLSPFNPAHTRETSFALLEVLPLLPEQQAVQLKPDDLDIEATTSSGHGGQSVNTTYSAIRITHKPTGIKVTIQNERSQHQNKELALKILAARVQAVQDAETAEQKKQLRGEFKSAEWGNQIRSYVLHPYKMVKDHRTNFESSDPEDILDGHLDDFVEKHLELKLHQSAPGK